jgi:hypothetical protein
MVWGLESFRVLAGTLTSSLNDIQHVKVQLEHDVKEVMRSEPPMSHVPAEQLTHCPQLRSEINGTRFCWKSMRRS